MASKALTSTALFLSLNILFFTMVSSANVPNCSPPAKGHHHHAPSVPPAPKPANTCPRDTVKIGACVNVLKDPSLVHLVLGQPPSSPECCPLIQGLADLEAAVCLCTTIKLNVLNVVNLSVPIDLSLLLNYCGKKVPSGYQCA
ncbi:hypothetical protein FNV43_RR09074 [Rhamnella rubrinervis]|uniref:Bifunctional inhibitor/plant lipid transfer protein/seed storage helical domain-containing protein n=1 Tax=Rhamnella rubrinervis TaxID=2594499 RepID=A0A8K0H9S9_9ROSA|nr:hypothetical protein FNV43_RR09074 [Rhamnella rubrinervis]